MLSKLTFAWRCRLRAVALTSRMMDTIQSCSGMVDLADRMGVVALSSYLRTPPGLEYLSSLESRLVSSLAVINSVRGMKGEAP